MLSVYRVHTDSDGGDGVTLFDATISTRKLSYRKDDRAMRHICGCPENFRESWVRPRLFFPTFLMGFFFCSDRFYERKYKFEVRSFTRSWDNSD